MTQSGLVRSPIAHRLLVWGTAAAAGAVLLLGPRPAPGIIQSVVPPGAQESPTAAANAIDELTEVMVQTREPRYVAPTRRDQIGRIWAPVLINGRGPFRLVLDTGATSSTVTAMVALALGIPLNDSQPVMLNGVTGEATVPTIRVETLSMGDLAVDSPLLPIIPDALGGAEGILGSEGLKNKRIFIDFRHDEIDIRYSRDERRRADSSPSRSNLVHGQLIVIDAHGRPVPTKAIIDTGGQASIGNRALREALNVHEHGLSRQTRRDHGSDPGRRERRDWSAHHPSRWARSRFTIPA